MERDHFDNYLFIKEIENKEPINMGYELSPVQGQADKENALGRGC